MDNFSITNLNFSPNKSKRGRFIIQETEISNDDDKINNNINNDKEIKKDNNNNIIDTINITTFESSPKLSELIEKDIEIVNPKLKSYRSTNLTKKRRISASFSKFHVNSKDDFSLNNNNRFLIYDLNLLFIILKIKSIQFLKNLMIFILMMRIIIIIIIVKKI